MLDASIPLRVQAPQMPDQMNALARALQIGGAMDEAQMSRMKMDEYRTGVAEQNALKQVLAGQGFSWDNPEQRNRAFAAAPTKAQGLYKGFVDVQKDVVGMDKSRQEMAVKGYDAFRSRVGALLNDPNATPELAASSIAELVQAGVMDPRAAAGVARNMPQDPQQLRRYLQNLATSGMTAEQQMTVFAPKVTKDDTGQQIVRRDDNPLSPTFGQQIGGPAVQKVTTPDAMLGAQTSTENNQRSVNAQLANAAATREVAAATRDSANVKDRRDTEMKLADDYRAQSKSYKEVEDAAARVKSALGNATKSAPATLSAATSFMKLLDPGSVVRESELVMALQASGALDRAMNSFNILQNGKVLTEQQAREFGKVTETLLQAARQQQQKLDTYYRNTAQRNNLRPEMVIQEIGQNSGGFRVLGVEK